MKEIDLFISANETGRKWYNNSIRNEIFIGIHFPTSCIIRAEAINGIINGINKSLKHIKIR